MKIKTRHLSYEEAAALIPARHLKPKKPSRLLAGIAHLLTKSELKEVGFSYKKTDMDKAGDGPWLVLMNHCSFTDLSIAFEVLKDKPFSIVCTSDALIGKEWLMRTLGCIPTRKFVSDITLISDMDHALRKNHASVLMYPEAGYSLDGTTTRIPRRIGVLIKKLKAPVVMITTYGAFSRDPLYNNLQKRNVRVSCEIKCLMSAEEVSAAKVREIDALIDKAFEIDYFKWQQENKIEITEPTRADGLHRILYKCPHCMTEGKTEGKGITLTCHECGAVYELDTLGFLKAINVEPKFTHIPDWFAWERKQTREEILNGTYLLDTECDIAILRDTKALYMIGTGRLRHDCSGFVLDGCGGKLHYEQGPTFSYSVNSDYFWYEIGDIVSIGTNDCLYFCFPKQDNIVAKTRLAAEELYVINKHPESVKEE